MNLITDKQEALKSLRNSATGLVIKNFSMELRDDFDIISEAVKIQGYRLQYASERLSNHPAIVRQATQKNQLSFKFAGKEIKKNKKFILEILQTNFSSKEIYKYCDAELKNDRNFTIDFIKRNGMGLKHCSNKFKADREIALLALESNDHSFCHILKSLRDEIEITKKALINPFNFEHVSKKFKNDENIVLLLVEHLAGSADFDQFKDIGLDLKKNKDFFLKVILKKPDLFQYASDELKKDPQLLEIVLKSLGCIIDYPYRNSKELITPQVKRLSYFLKFAPEEVLNDRHVILRALQKDINSFHYASPEIKNMLGHNRNEYVQRLTKIISIESLAEKLDGGLDKKATPSNKNKI